jgi:CDP-glycerol glycerophosphotransferase (TagB/SpsB family)
MVSSHRTPKFKKIFITTYGGAHVKIMIPVMRKLLACGFEVVFLALTTAPSELDKEKLPYKKISDYLDLFKESASEILNLGESLMGSVTLHPQVSKEETVTYLGLSYWALESNVGTEKAKELYQNKGRMAFKPVQVLKRILEFEKPDLVLTTCSPRSEEATLIAARELGIKSAFIVNMYMYDLFKNQKFYENQYADHAFLPSEEAYKMMAEFGRNPNSMSVSGNPAFESHFAVENIEAAEKLRKQYFSNKDLVILFAKAPSHTAFAEKDRAIENQLFSLIQRHSHFGLILRDHPNENVQQGHNDRGGVVTLNKENISILLNACDIVVTQVSTVGIEAHLIGKSMFFICDPTFQHFENVGAGKRAHSIDELIQFIETSKKSKPVLKQEFSSTDHIVKKIAELLR